MKTKSLIISNTDFRNEVHEILGQHESSIDQVHSILQTVLTKLQSLSTSQGTQPNNQDINPFAPTESSHPFNQATTIYKFEQYFEFKEVTPKQQVQLASFHLEGIALQWHRWFTKFRGLFTWKEFTKALLLRFGPTDYEDPSEALTRLKQSTKALSLCRRTALESFLVGCFIAELRDDIRLDVKIKQPRTLADAIGVARLVEERNNLQKKNVSLSKSNPIGNQFKMVPNNSVGVL
ncbi:hypothetical protein ACOSQ3_027609 [Xanthoceras sorbifolium]